MLTFFFKFPQAPQHPEFPARRADLLAACPRIWPGDRQRPSGEPHAFSIMPPRLCVLWCWGGAPSCRRTTGDSHTPAARLCHRHKRLLPAPHTPGSSGPSERVGDNCCFPPVCVLGSRSFSPTAVKVGTLHGFQPARASSLGEGPLWGSHVAHPCLDPQSSSAAAALALLVRPAGCWPVSFRSGPSAVPSRLDSGTCVWRDGS